MMKLLTKCIIAGCDVLTDGLKCPHHTPKPDKKHSGSACKENDTKQPKEEK